MTDLNKIKIMHSSLTDRILIARFCKDETTALDTRDAMNDFWQALASYCFDGKMPAKGDKVEVSFGGGDEQFILTLERKGD